MIESGPYVKKEVEKDDSKREHTKDTFANSEEIKTEQNKRRAIKSKFAPNIYYRTILKKGCIAVIMHPFYIENNARFINNSRSKLSN